uniref:BHLH domain-containing protein n=1 Tax=Leersia perrieri TaxID=77586 RepID=A0A0D9UVV9_9ORYZ
MEKGGSSSSSRRRSRATVSTSSGSVSSTAAAAERKEMERRRRQDMKGLCLKLASLIPKEHYSKGGMRTQLSSVDEAAAYIKKLKERVDELPHRRSIAMGNGGVAISPSTSGSGGSSEDVITGEKTVLEVRQHVQEGSSSLDVVLICSVERPVKFHEVITVLEEEGAEIVHANFSVAAHKIYYTIFSRAFSSRIGIEASRITERLRALVIQ